ncbi:MAG TPA: lipoprotein [Cellvibrio sp.]|nr:lipoprotein [Cellvibrio sp.]
MKIAVVSLLFCLGLVACGQTGPLYLPEPEAETPSPQTAPEQPRTEQSEAEQSGTEPAKASPAASPATTPQ